MKEKINAMVLSGGFGTRLWPISRQEVPKQFSNILFGESLFGKTINLLQNDIVDDVFVISNQKQDLFVKNEIKCFKNITTVLEPESKNTALSIAIGCLLAKNDNPILIMPSDHLITEKDKFFISITNGMPLAMDGKIVTFGVKPTFPSTGYGYIKKGKINQNGFDVLEFKEKPDIKTAKTFIESGEYFWNAGIYFFKPSVFLKELAEHSNKTLEVAKKAILTKKIYVKSNIIEFEPNSFSGAQSISIDYAVSEKTKNISTVEMLSSWSDVGDFGTVAEHLPKDENNNSIDGDVEVLNTKNCTIISTNKLVATVGVKDLCIIDTQDALLVVDKNKVQDIKNLVEHLGSKNRLEVMCGTRTERPWGSFENIKQSNGYKVKYITVEPFSSLSLQSHQHRSEHWIVVEGIATVFNDSQTIELKYGQSTFIEAGKRHRLTNNTDKIVSIIEVQIGNYLGEDDITRYEDLYGRR